MTTDEFAERSCIVTGGTRGLGREIVRLLLDAGARVVAVGRSRETCVALEEQIANRDGRLVAVARDVSREETGADLVRIAIDQWGQVDVVINNAAPFRYRQVKELPTRDEWFEVFSTKLMGYWSLMTAALPHLVKTKGAITNVAGGAGIVASPTAPHNSAINAAIIAMSESYALRYASQGVRINVVTPNTIDNDRFAERTARHSEERGISMDDARAELSARVPIGHPADPTEIARIVLLTSSPNMRSLTGAHLVVDGASHLRGHGRSG